MTKYEIVKLPGASSDLVTAALNKRAKEGFILKFVDNGWFVMVKWEEELTKSEKQKSISRNDIPMTRENENETEDVEIDLNYGLEPTEVEIEDENPEPWELDMAHPKWEPKPKM